MKKRFIKNHNDGSLWAKGWTENGKMTGYWEWFRLDGSKMGSGYFKNSKKVGNWTTFDKTGKQVRVTNFDPK